MMTSFSTALSILAAHGRAVALFAASVGCTILLLGVAGSLPSPAVLQGIEVVCPQCELPQEEMLALYALQERWLAFALLLITVAAGAVVAAVVTLVGVGIEKDSAGRGLGAATAIVAGLGVIAAAYQLHLLNRPDGSSHGFLSSLLGTLANSGGKEDVVRQMVWPLRKVGEGAALLVGAAMAATASPTRDAATLARRIERLQFMLYCASLLFVAGILTSESNFTWVTAHWAIDPKDEGLAKAVADTVKAGTLQSGVGYSALLAIFFLPARSVLAWQARRMAPPGDARDRADDEKALEAAGLVSSWRDDLKQILALLAPVLSAPVVDALLG
jgi:hypothetical protein